VAGRFVRVDLGQNRALAGGLEERLADRRAGELGQSPSVEAEQVGRDQILVVESGQIVERGTHAELIEIAGRYKQLYDKQYLFEQNLFINPGEELKSKPGEAMAQTKL